MKGSLRIFVGMSLVVGVLLAGCGGQTTPTGTAQGVPSATAAVEQQVMSTATPTVRVEAPTVTFTVAPSQAPQEQPTGDAQKTQQAQRTMTSTARENATATRPAATQTPMMTRTAAPTRTPVPTPLKPPVYGLVQSYRTNGSSGGEKLWQVPGLEQKTPLDPTSEQAQTKLYWDSLRWRTYDWQRRMVKVEQAEGMSSCSIWKDGEWQRVIEFPMSQISLLADQIEGRQQVWIWDCALSPDGTMLGLNIVGGGTQWYDRSVIYTVNVDGSNLSRRTPSVYGTVYMQVFWHPFKQILFYQRTGEKPNYAYVTYNFETGKRWTASGNEEVYPDSGTFSPDGRWFTFIGEKRGIYFVDVFNEGAPQFYSMAEDVMEVKWSPSGSQMLVIYSTGGNTYGAKVFEVNYFPQTGQPDRILALTKQIDLGNQDWLYWIPWQTQAPERSVCDGAGTSALEAGDYAYGNPAFKGALQVRQTPSGSGKLQTTLRPYQRVIVMNGPRCEEGKVWWQVYVPETEQKGWAIEMDGGTRQLVPLIPPEGRHAQPAAGTGEPTPPTATLPPATGGEQVCPGAPVTQLKVGMQAMVSTDSATPNRVRAEPSSSGQQVGLLPPGTKMTIEAGPSCANNYTWWKVTATVDGQKITGWTVEGDKSSYWLVPVK